MARTVPKADAGATAANGRGFEPVSAQTQPVSRLALREISDIEKLWNRDLTRDNAIERAIGMRLTELPISPPKVLAAIDARGQK
jgi:hypothetical protein